jgi:HSF-type DNA-binding
MLDATSTTFFQGQRLTDDVVDECGSGSLTDVVTGATVDECGSGSVILQAAKLQDVPRSKSKTAKNHTRHYVHHDYHDHSQDSIDDQQWLNAEDMNALFPIKLHCVLSNVDSNGMDHIISWAQHGRCFKIHKPKEFLEHIVKRYLV